MTIPKIDDNGVIRPMTQAEMDRLAAEMPPVEPDPNEKRMDEIEMALMELAEMLAGGAV